MAIFQKLLKVLVVFPILVFVIGHFMLTGSPIPLWHIENLDSPVQVERVSETVLILEDGREVALPFIETLPKNDPVFQLAIEEGVEISNSGEVIGLLWVSKLCGNEAVAWRRHRINLSELAGALNPDGIDGNLVHADEIKFLKDTTSGAEGLLRTSSSKRVRGDLHRYLRQSRRLFEHIAERPDQK